MAEVSYLISMTRVTTTMSAHLDQSPLSVVAGGLEELKPKFRTVAEAVEGVANFLNQAGEAVVAEKTLATALAPL